MSSEKMSACCNALLEVGGTSEGTKYYMCTECENPADPKPMSAEPDPAQTAKDWYPVEEKPDDEFGPITDAELGEPDRLKPEALSDEEWARSLSSRVACSSEWMVKDAVYVGAIEGIAESRRRERGDGVAARLASDALCAISGAGGVTPQEGYLKAPFCLQSDIERVISQREEAAAREMAEIIISDNPPLGNREFGKDVIELYMQDWKQRKEGGG